MTPSARGSGRPVSSSDTIPAVSGTTIRNMIQSGDIGLYRSSRASASRGRPASYGARRSVTGRQTCLTNAL